MFITDLNPRTDSLYLQKFSYKVVNKVCPEVWSKMVDYNQVNKRRREAFIQEDVDLFAGIARKYAYTLINSKSQEMKAKVRKMVLWISHAEFSCSRHGSRLKRNSTLRELVARELSHSWKKNTRNLKKKIKTDCLITPETLRDQVNLPGSIAMYQMPLEFLNRR